jgi:hypothetical protein
MRAATAISNLHRLIMAAHHFSFDLARLISGNRADALLLGILGNQNIAGMLRDYFARNQTIHGALHLLLPHDRTIAGHDFLFVLAGRAACIAATVAAVMAAVAASASPSVG